MAILAMIGYPCNGGFPEQTTLPNIQSPLASAGSQVLHTGYWVFHPSAQERTSAGSFLAGLPVTDPTSLEAAPRVLLSVSAFVHLAAPYYTKVRKIVK